MKQLTLDNQDFLATDAGFSIIEALVVMLIGSMLLSVLTPMLISSQRINEKVSEVFEDREDRIFFDLQFSELLDSFLDPALKSATFAVEKETVFTGSPTSISAKSRAPFVGGSETRNVWIGWTKHNPSETAPRVATGQENKLVAIIGNQWIIWPQVWPDDARLFYIDSEGTRHSSWPPIEQVQSAITTNATFIPDLPLAIEIKHENGPERRSSYFIYNIKL